MSRERIVISTEEEKRFKLLTLVGQGLVTLGEAAQAMGVSYRHAKRLKKKAADGIRGLVHGNSGMVRDKCMKVPIEQMGDVYMIHARGLAKDQVRAIIVDSKVKMEQIDWFGYIALLLLSGEKIAYADAQFYADCFAYEHEIPCLAQPSDEEFEHEGKCHRPRYTAPVMVGRCTPPKVGRSAPPAAGRCGPPGIGWSAPLS